jgi:hypothetical protein
VYRRRDAARLAFALGACADGARSPLPADIFGLPYPQQTGALYVAALALLPKLIASPDDFRSLWADEERQLAESERLIDAGVVTIEERPELDLGIVRQPADVPRYHPFAVHSRTERTRVALIRGGHFELSYRYEGWVQLASRRPALRVDLTNVAEALNRQERDAGRWVAEAVDHIEPRFYFAGSSPVTRPEQALDAVVEQLRTGAPALDPYGG